MGTCIEQVRCLKKSCDESILTQNHLAPSGEANSEYLHGETVSVACTDGYTLANDDSPSDTVDIMCSDGNWTDLPQCRRFADCQLSPITNGYFQIGGQNVGSGSQSPIQLNHGLTAT